LDGAWEVGCWNLKPYDSGCGYFLGCRHVVLSMGGGELDIGRAYRGPADSMVSVEMEFRVVPKEIPAHRFRAILG
jgi:hypothetical protein